MIDTRDGRKRDIPGWAQVFGSAFMVISATVTAATLSGAAVAGLTAGAAIFLCSAIVTGLNQQPWTARKKLVTAASTCVAVILIPVAAWVGIAHRQQRAGPPQTTAEASGEDPALAISSPSYSLMPSSSIFTNDQDKVDLDTAANSLTGRPTVEISFDVWAPE